MDLSFITEYISQYGLIFLFIVVLLEYLNLPGFPAGIILPVAGIWAHSAGINLILVIVISVAAGLIGSWALYFIGLYGGDVLIRKYVKRFTKHKKYIYSKIKYLNEK